MTSPGPQPIDEHDQHAGRHGQEMKIERFFRAMQKLDASDLHLKAGCVPHYRTQTVLRKSNQPKLTGEEILDMSRQVMTEKQWAYFQEHGSIDLAHDLSDSDRFRINIFRQRGELSLAARRVTRNIPAFEDLHLPEAVKEIASEHQGLVLLSGPTGSGKSTTIA